MKKCILAILLFVATISNSQILLEHTYNNVNTSGAALFEIVHLSSGYKYAYSDTKGNLDLYNLNHSLFKSIPIPPIPTSSSDVSIMYISDSLFNTTTADIEYVLEFEDKNSNTCLRIFNDSGTTLFSKDSAGLTSNLTGALPIYNTSNGYKMIVYAYSHAALDTTVFVYSLPGGLPCEECSTNPYTGIEQLHPGPSGYLSSPYPNPNSHATSIKYELPDGVSTGQIIFYDLSGREIKHYTVDRTFNTLELTTSDLASGTYLYILQTTSGNIGNRKMTVIK